MHILNRDLQVVDHSCDHALGETLVPTLLFLAHAFSITFSQNFSALDSFHLQSMCALIFLRSNVVGVFLRRRKQKDIFDINLDRLAS